VGSSSSLDGGNKPGQHRSANIETAVQEKSALQVLEDWTLIPSQYHKRVKKEVRLWVPITSRQTHMPYIATCPQLGSTPAAAAAATITITTTKTHIPL
jgi:hypothetical protein